MAHSSFSERALYFFGLGFGRLIYRIKITGQTNLPVGGFLLLPNHITWVDAIVLQIACPRRIRFIIHDEYYQNRWLHPFLRVAGWPNSTKLVSNSPTMIGWSTGKKVCTPGLLRITTCES